MESSNREVPRNGKDAPSDVSTNGSGHNVLKFEGCRKKGPDPLRIDSQKNAKDKKGQVLVDSRPVKQRASQVDSHQDAFKDNEGEDGHYHVDRFLAKLDDLESARPAEENEAQNVTSSVVSTRARPSVFNDWIDEADFMEANATMPQGTRYYFVHGSV
ncbi:hypothetical protein Hte_001886 [Hypoxylon texense]